jgi:5'-3' exonuclease
MGIKSNWNTFLKSICNDIFESKHISEYAYKKIAIDISLYLHKFKAICGDRWLDAFINLIVKLRENDVHCVFVFDGKAPPEKGTEQNKRREERNKMRIKLQELEEAYQNFIDTHEVDECIQSMYDKRRVKTPNDILDKDWIEKKIESKKSQLYSISEEDIMKAKELFDILEVPYITAESEAEKLCSKICIDGNVEAVLSEDTDVMTYNTPVFITKFDTSSGKCVVIKNENLLKGLELEKHQLVDLCIMCGTDYNMNIPKVGSKTAYKYIKKHGTIDEIKRNTKLDTSILKYERSRELFTQFDDCSYNLKDIKFCGQPSLDNIRKFFTENNVNVSVDKVYKHFSSVEELEFEIQSDSE